MISLDKLKSLALNPVTIHLVSIAAVLCLILSSSYAAYKTAGYQSVNSDTTANTYYLKDGLDRHQIKVQDQHTNLLKFPFFTIQGALPFNIATFAAGNALLVTATMLGWLLLLVIVFGQKYTTVIALALATFLLSSLSLNLNISYSTVRNIEFPLVLFFVVSAAKYLNSKKRHDKTALALLVVSTIILLLCLASDSFLYYAIALPMLLFLGILLLDKTYEPKKYC